MITSTSGDNPASRSRTAEQQVRPLQFQVACPGETARRQRVDASDRFFAVCKLALAFTRGHVRANQEVDQALVHLVGCLLALALVPLRCLLPKNALTVLSVRVRPMYLWAQGTDGACRRVLLGGKPRAPAAWGYLPCGVVGQIKK